MLSQRIVAACVLCAAAFISPHAQAQDGPWSVTLYGGVGTNNNMTQILGQPVHFNGHDYGRGFPVDNAMFGVALDRRLAYLGWGFSLAAEGQLTYYTFGHNYETGALGIGVQFDRFPWTLPTTLSIYTGPTYAVNPPRPPLFKGKALLNYIGLELAVAIPRSDGSPQSDGWEAVARIYHRSGVWGLYSLNDDEGTVIGVGIRKRF